MPKVKLARNLRKETRLDILNQIIKHRMIDERLETQDQLASYLGIDHLLSTKGFLGKQNGNMTSYAIYFLFSHFSPEEIAKAMGAN